MAPLLAALTTMGRPQTGLAWLRNPQVPRLLADLATGRIPLTHAALHALPNWRTVAYLRDLLMACSVLPAVDKQLLHFETWLHQRLNQLVDHPDARLLHQFGAWHQLPKLRAKAATRPLTISTRAFAAQQFTQAHRFLIWLRDRDQAPATLTQAALDAWYATHRDHHKRPLRGFLTWAMHAGRLPRLAVPLVQVRRGTPITQARRLALLRQVLLDEHGPLRSRVAACLMLLFAQPASRIVRLTIDDHIRTDDGQVLIRFGDLPTPVPEPFVTLLLRAAAQRDNLRTATNPGARWLFPDRRGGQPLGSRTLADLVRGIGVPTQAVRTAALRQLVLQAPAPVIAQALGFHHKTTTRVATEAGTPGSHYASGDHSQWSSPK